MHFTDLSRFNLSVGPFQTQGGCVQMQSGTVWHFEIVVTPDFVPVNIR